MQLQQNEPHDTSIQYSIAKRVDSPPEDDASDANLEADYFPPAADSIRTETQLRHFYAEHIDGVGRLVRAKCYRTPDGAEDVLQETYPRLLAIIQKGESGIHEPWALLNVVASHIAIDEIRRSATRNRRFQPLHEDSFISPDSKQAVSNVMSDETKCIIQNALLLLEGRQRQVITQIFLDGRRARHVARELGLSESYVAEIKAAGLAKLRSYLKDSLHAVDATSL